MKQLLVLCVLLWATQLKAEPISADLSQREIAINATFRGINMLLFGARGEAGTIVVVVRGPLADYVVRKKERIGGIWVNRHNQSFLQVPVFYHIASSRPLEALENQRLLQALGIGGEYMAPEKVLGDARNHMFWEAFVAEQRKQGLYAKKAGKITFWGETLFKTELHFPKNIPQGVYQAEIYLLRDGGVSALQTTPIRVEKIGFEAYIYTLAHQRPLLYGLLCVMLAMLAGWVVNHFFRKI